VFDTVSVDYVLAELQKTQTAAAAAAIRGAGVKHMTAKAAEECSKVCR
jgi:hypothetical protein